MLNSLKAKSNAELILELEERGFDVRPLKAALHKREFSASKVVSIDALRGAEGL